MRTSGIGVLELIASTAALHSRLRPSFWAELAVKRQFYSVMPQAVSVWARARGHESLTQVMAACFARAQSTIDRESPRSE